MPNPQGWAPGAVPSFAVRDPVSEAPPPPLDKNQSAVPWQNPAATLGKRSARFEREPLMNNTLTHKGMESRTWNGVAIQRRPVDGYVNATAMCKSYGRLFADYRRLDRTNQYLQALSRSMGIPIDVLVQQISSGLNELRGTWIHPRIAVDLARWLHPTFAVWMDGWFLESVTQKVVADPAPEPSPMFPSPRQRKVYEVGGPGVNLSGMEAVASQLNEILDAYTLYMKAKHDAMQSPCPGQTPFTPFRSPRFAIKVFLEWFVGQHGTLLFALSPVAAVAAPPLPPVPPQPKPTAPGHVPQQDGYSSGDLITGPDLAHLLGLDTHTINKWAAARLIGAERDGWRLIGRGKLSAGKQCATYPPGCASWLFIKV